MPKKPTPRAAASATKRRLPAKPKAPRRAPPRSGGRPRLSALASTFSTASGGGAPPFPEVSDTHPPDQSRDINVPGLGRNAANDAERHLALEHAVSGLWAGADISAIRRVESGPSHKWVMWRRSSVPPV